jgi:hypothetical protein
VPPDEILLAVTLPKGCGTHVIVELGQVQRVSYPESVYFSGFTSSGCSGSFGTQG